MTNTDQALSTQQMIIILAKCMQCTYKALIGMRVRGEDDIHARLVEQALHGPAPWCARLVLYQGTCMSMHQQPRRPAPVHRRKAPPRRWAAGREEDQDESERWVKEGNLSSIFI